MLFLLLLAGLVGRDVSGMRAAPSERAGIGDLDVPGPLARPGVGSLLDASASSARHLAEAQFPVGHLLAPALLSQRGGPLHAPVAGSSRSAAEMPSAGDMEIRPRSGVTRLEAVGTPAGYNLDLKEEDMRGLRWVMATDGTGLAFSLKIPEDWADKLVLETLSLTAMDLGSQVFSVNLACDPETQVVLRVEQACDAIDNELLALERFRSSGVVAYFEKRSIGDRVYILMEATSCSLNDIFVQTLREEETAFSEGLFFPLKTSVRVLIDLLRGARDMADAGVVHRSLTPRSVRLLEDGQALISDFRGSSIVDEWSVRFGPPLPGLAYRHAPETIAGYPNAPSNNVWAVGTIFAEMVLGYVPMRKAFLQQEPQMVMKTGWMGVGREQIRSYVSEEFSIREDAGFRRLEDSALQDLMSAMLTADSGERVTAEAALSMALSFAEQRGITVRAERTPPSLPECWSEWQ